MSRRHEIKTKKVYGLPWRDRTPGKDIPRLVTILIGCWITLSTLGALTAIEAWGSGATSTRFLPHRRPSCAQVFSWPNFVGAWTYLTDYCSDLAWCSQDGVNYDNVISSACVSGMWLFYEDYEFGRNGRGAMEYAYGTNFCFNLNFVNDAASSARYVGDREDYMATGLTVYQHRSFKGAEYFTQFDVPVFPLTAIRGWPASAIISGNVSWTLFEYPYYSGRSICLHARTDYFFPTLFIDDMVLTNLPALGSMSKGCQQRRGQVDLYPTARSRLLPRKKRGLLMTSFTNNLTLSAASGHFSNSENFLLRV